MERMLDGEEPLDLGPAPGPTTRALDPLLDRVAPTSRRRWAGSSPASTSSEPLGALAARLRGRRGQPRAPICRAVLELLDGCDEHVAPPEDGRPIPAAGRLLVFALVVARTPDVPLPALPGAPHATRADAEAHEPS